MLKSRILRGAVARYGRAFRGMTLGVRILAIDAQGRVMLVRHGYAPGWHLPGGAVETGETAETAAARELLEETGVRADGRFDLFGLYFNPAFGGRDHVALFHATRFVIGPEPAPNREIRERGWFAPGAMPEDVTPATLRRLGEVAGQATPTGLW